MPEYIERGRLIDDLTQLAKYQTGERQQGILGVINTIRLRKAADVVPLALLEKWLYEIAFNNLGTGSQKDTAFAESCEEIINRLDGLRAFIRDETNN